ncbi:hypothetical protein AHT79_000868 [Salmonella enterica subsp. enterica]|nr:hypothetical protein [Salmonella enterica subsp. enterica serovar Bere]
MIIIALRSGEPYGEPESTTLLTLLPVLFWPAFAGFFFGFVSAWLTCHFVPGKCSCSSRTFSTLRALRACREQTDRDADARS